MNSASSTQNKSQFLIELMTLEIFSNFYLLERHKEEVGLITQWGVGAWLILQTLAEQSPQIESELAAHQHISSSYNHKLVNDLAKHGLIESNKVGDVAHLSITTNGKHNLKKLSEVLHNNFPNWSESFSEEELHTTVNTLSKFRHLLSQ